MDAGQTLSLVATLGPGQVGGPVGLSCEQQGVRNATPLYLDLTICFYGLQSGPPPHMLVANFA